uniref:Conotoxin au5b n=1 Tax=Conus aulicus TaxID=89437 RepID=CT5B_CONAL|nr:RecName: Full=Conotoxin au5b [Conus aulicus]
FCCPVIRYCCW